MLTEKLSKNIIKDFIDRSIPFKDRIVMVTDLKKEYDVIMDELNFDHQLCTFHLEKHLWELVNKEANKIAKKIPCPIKKRKP